MSARIIAAFALPAALGTLITACQPRPTAPPGGWFMPAPPTLSCRIKALEDPCISCAKVNCCAESQACEADHRCLSLMRCARQPWPFTECVSDERVGPVNDLYRAERACLSTYCPTVCPTEHGGPAP